ncbi:Aste57867_23379 [Aphanomyces stellatus]|uniref:Aste57867_23379 protein n=1 Tax=Aphanomyces stellatus TaxID=120398 RepID=A0A485LNK6_9STRA|nr:hypothetical protein As57867_023308 [Aphanomyces stellatus]VFU00025.1 Aste57867_23379 [Aphanomyces stellatus]
MSGLGLAMSSSTSSLTDELAETERLIQLQEQKLALLRQLRRGLTNAKEDDPPLEQLLTRLLEPSHACDASADSFHSHFVERHSLALDAPVVALRTFRLLRPNKAYQAMLMTASAAGHLRFFDVPTGAPVATFLTNASSETVVSASIDVDSVAGDAAIVTLVRTASILVYNLTTVVPQDNNLTAVTVALSPTPLHYPTQTSLDGRSTTTTAAFSSYHGEKLVFLATAASNTIHALLSPSMTSLATLSALDAPVHLVATHRHLLAVGQGPHVRLFPLSRLGEQVHYTCHGTRDAVIALAFDVAVPTVMYATTAAHDLLVFDLFADRARHCRLLHRSSLLDPSSSSSSLPLSLLLALPGYVVVASATDVRVFNTSDVVHQRPRHLSGLTRRSATSPLPLHGAVLFGNDVEGAHRRHHLVCLSHGGAVMLLESLLPSPPDSATAADTSFFSLDAWTSRIPILVVVVGAIVVYNLFFRTRGDASMDDPASMAELERMMRPSSSSKPPSSFGRDEMVDPTFDPPSSRGTFNRPKPFRHDIY